jgi:hypothetical protein
MREALLVVVAVFLAAALRRIDRLVHRQDDLRDRNLRDVLGKDVATSGSAHAFHELMPA